MSVTDTLPAGGADVLALTTPSGATRDDAVTWTVEQLQQRLLSQYRIREDGSLMEPTLYLSTSSSGSAALNGETTNYDELWPLTRFYLFSFKERPTVGHAIHMASADSKGAQVVSMLLELEADPNDNEAIPQPSRQVGGGHSDLCMKVSSSSEAPTATIGLSSIAVDPAGGRKRAQTQKTLRPLHFAAGTGNIETIRLLVQAQADVNVRTTMGDVDDYTALHEAAYFGRHDAVDVLVELNAEVNAVNRKKETALHVVAQSDHSNNWVVAKSLLRARIDVTLENEETGGGRTALMIACNTNYPSDKLFLLCRRCIEDVIRVAMVDPRTTLDVLMDGGGMHGAKDQWKNALCNPEDPSDIPTHNDLVTLVHLAPAVAAETLELLTISPNVKGVAAYYHPIPRHSKEDSWCMRRCQYVPDNTWNTVKVGTSWIYPTWHDLLAPHWTPLGASAAVSVKDLPTRTGSKAIRPAPRAFEKRSRVEVKMLKMPNVINLHLIFAITESDEMVLFKAPATQAILDCVWVQLVRSWYVAHFIIRSIELTIIVSVSLWAPADTDVEYGLWSFLFVTAIREILIEIRQALNYHRLLGSFYSYIGNPSNWGDWMAMCMLSYLVLSTWVSLYVDAVPRPDWVTRRRLLAVVAVQRWVQILHMLCAFSVFDMGYSLIPLMSSITKVGGMTLLAFIAMLAFTSGFVALDANNHCVTQANCELVEVQEYIQGTFLNTFRLLVLGDGVGIDWLVNVANEKAGDTPHLIAQWALYLSVVIFCIFILNLWIAVHGQAYQEASAIVTESFYAKRANIVLLPMLQSCWFPSAADVVLWRAPFRQLFQIVLDNPTRAYILWMFTGLVCWSSLISYYKGPGGILPAITLLVFTRVGDQILLRRPMWECVLHTSLFAVAKDLLARPAGDSRRGNTQAVPASKWLETRQNVKEWLKTNLAETGLGTRSVQSPSGEHVSSKPKRERMTKIQESISLACAEELYLWWCTWTLDQDDRQRDMQVSEHDELMEHLGTLDKRIQDLTETVHQLATPGATPRAPTPKAARAMSMYGKLRSNTVDSTQEERTPGCRCAADGTAQPAPARAAVSVWDHSRAAVGDAGAVPELTARGDPEGRENWTQRRKG